jgi:hypothetical protein
VVEFATNTILHRLYGGSDAQAGALDLARVSVDDAAGHLTGTVDSRLARSSALNSMFRGGGLLALPFQIVAGDFGIEFLDGGRRVRGYFELYGEGYVEAGTASVVLLFEGEFA